MVIEAAMVGGATAAVIVIITGVAVWLLRLWLQRKRYQDDLGGGHRRRDDAVVYERYARGRRIHWDWDRHSGSSSKGYSEINKGPDRPARSRMAGKVGLANRSERGFSDWKTDHIVSRIAGRRDAQKVKTKPVRKPKPR